MSQDLPSREYVASLLAYEPETGIIRRTQGSRGARAGQIAGSPNSHGYLRLKIGEQSYLAHRVAWMLSHGEWPAGQIDHINGVRSDNRLSNLRVCSAAENRRNSKTPRTNSSGIKGVSWHHAANAWHAQIKSGGQVIYGGTFKELEDAKRAVMELRERLHGEFSNHGHAPSHSEKIYSNPIP